MIGGGTFILANASRSWPETAKQAEIRLAILLKMRPIAILGQEGLAGVTKTSDGCINRYFLWDMANSPELLPLLSGSQFSPGY
jgi:hypothetical protein